MLANGFKINEYDKCVFIKDTPNHQVIVCLYVDDMLIISRDISDINATKRMLESKFDMKDLGVADVILGIRIHQTPQGLALSQSHYIEKVLDKFKYMEFGIAKTPLDASFALRKNEGKSDSQLEYARVLGCLMYIMNCTRPDIACAISKLIRYMSDPNKTYWMAMKRVLGYLKYTQNYALHYNKYPAVLEGYSDENWIIGLNEVKFRSGYVFTIDGGAVSWKSFKQTCIARSTMKSEFITLDKAGEEAEWLHNFLEDISYWPKPVAPVCIHCDSQAAIGRAGSMMYNGKSRHIRRRHNTVRELLSSGIITIDYVKSKDNVSDPLTKGLSREGVERISNGMGLRPRTSQHSDATVCTVSVNSCDVSSWNAETFSDTCRNAGTGAGSSEITIVFLTYELQAKWIAQVLSGKVVLPSKEEMLAVVEDHNRHLEEAGIPKHHTHLLHPHELEYIDWIAAQVGMPPVGADVKEMYWSIYKYARVVGYGCYRDLWDIENFTQLSL
ncbi:hypothetical protein BC332_13316 [Capsicum chinense]|nr:hypothetical protein BC332_13316 [Capsicum chinense]